MVVNISISGGRTSAYMAVWMTQNQEAVADYLDFPPEEVEYSLTFANTGMEHEDTLRFLHAVDTQMLDGKVVWLEADVRHGVRKSSGHRIVTYETAYRNHQWRDPNHPFHSEIRKYGVPNKTWLHCTRELKANTMKSYRRGEGITAIGIRADENRRVSKNATTERLIYPLVDLHPTDKEDVLAFWEDYDFDLRIPEWQGNCIMCYKKSFKKLNAVWTETPEAFDFTDAMEQQYGFVGPEFAKGVEKPRVFFREHRSTQDMIALFKHHDSDPASFIVESTQDDGCGESCELYPTEYYNAEAS